MDDFDERMNEIKDDIFMDKAEKTDIPFKHDYGHSLYEEDRPKPTGPARGWHDLRARMAENFQYNGPFIGTIKSIGMLVADIISLPVTLVRYLVLRDARPHDFDKDIAKAEAADDLKEHLKKSGNEQKLKKELEKQQQLKESQKVNPLPLHDKDDEKKPVVNDRTRMKDAINRLRTEVTETKENGKEVSRKMIAGIPFVGYTAKTGSLLFYNKGAKADEVTVDSKSISSGETGKKVAEVFAKRESENYLNSINENSSVKMTQVPSSQEKAIFAQANVKAGMYLAAIKGSLGESRQGDVLSNIPTNNGEIAFKMTDNGDVGVFLNGENTPKTVLSMSDIQNIKDETIREVIMDCDLMGISDFMKETPFASEEEKQMSDDFDEIQKSLIDNPDTLAHEIAMEDQQMEEDGFISSFEATDSEQALSMEGTYAVPEQDEIER